MSVTRILLMTLLVVFVAQTYGAAQETGRIRVEGIAGVLIYLDDELAGVTRKDLGGLTIDNVPVGTHQISARRPGCKTQVLNLTVSAGGEQVFSVLPFERRPEEEPEVDSTAIDSTGTTPGPAPITAEGDSPGESLKDEVSRTASDPGVLATGALAIVSTPVECTIEIPSVLPEPRAKTGDTLRIEEVPIGLITVILISGSDTLQQPISILPDSTNYVTVDFADSSVTPSYGYRRSEGALSVNRRYPRPSDMVNVDTFAIMVYYEEPVYPESAKAEGVEGTAWVKSLIGETGKLIESMLARTSGNELLDSAAMAAAPRCRFIPAIKDDRPVASWSTYKVDFKLDSEVAPHGAPRAIQDAEIGDNRDSKKPTETVIPAEMTRFKDPKYPKDARRKGVEGVVWVRALVNEKGKVEEAEIHESSNRPSLDLAALDAARGCRFSPATKDGEPVESWVNYEVEFKLDDQDAHFEDPLIDGEGVVDVEAEMVYYEKPKYPSEAKREGWSGVVLVKALVGKDGDVLDALVEKTSGHLILDEEAIRVAPDCKFKPAIKNNTPVATWVTYEVKFDLDDQ